MPGPVITRPKNKTNSSQAASFLFLLIGFVLWAGVTDALPVPPLQSPPAQSSPPGKQDQDQDGTFVIRKDVDEVVLHATVIDGKDHIVTDLDRNAFTVFEDGKPQNIVSF